MTKEYFESDFYQLEKLDNNLHSLKVGKLFTIYFSYKTIVAFEVAGKLERSKNVWSTTTGKHLRIIAEQEHEKSATLDHQVFLKRLHQAMKDYGAVRALASL